MNVSRLRLATLAALAALSTLAVSAFAQQAPAAAASATAAQPECAKTVKRHDHGADRNTPSPATMPCKTEPAGAAASAGGKKVAPHDHAKIHKNQ